MGSARRCCIRSALPEHPNCPSCRKPASEVHIRKDVVMENAVQAWKTARPLILRLALEDLQRKTQPENIRKANGSERAPKRRRLRSPQAGSEDEVVIIPSSPAPSASSTSSAALPELVLCPMCDKEVPSQTINMHIDSNCKRYLSERPPINTATTSKTKQKQQWSHLFGGASGSSGSASTGKNKGKNRARNTPDKDEELEHLPLVAYDIHKQKRIAELLAEWDLPTHGDKNALVRRHKKWIVLYNANVDRAPAHRRTLDQLRAELRKLEEAEQKTRKETVDDPVAYQKANKAAFAKLTEAAFAKLTEAARPKPEVKAEGVAEGNISTLPDQVWGDMPEPHDVIDVDES